MRSTLLFALLPTFTLACSSATSSSEPAGGSDDPGAESALTHAESLKVSLKIADSNVVFSSKVEGFAIKDGRGLELPCRDRGVYMHSAPSLYEGWSPTDAPRFSDDDPNSKFHEYQTVSCRNAETQVLGWFLKEREYEFSVSEQLLDKDYKPQTLPLVLKMASLGSGEATYYSCASEFKKTLINETANAKHYDIEASCTKRAAPSKKELGPIDFIENPGAYGAVASYKPWMLPPVASNKTNFNRVRDALLSKVAEGKYSGAMSTLSKTCGLKVKATDGSLLVDHTIESSNRTRHLELKTEDLLGFVEGNVYSDPIRVNGEPIGKFAAAEFRDDKGESVVVRFEKNTNAEGMIVRIDGAEAYCRRLQ